MVARDKVCHGLDELVAEGGAIGRGPEPNLGIKRQGRQSLVSRQCSTEQIADLVQLPGQRALILVQPEPFKNLAGVSIIPLADGRGFLALDAGRGVSDLELSVIDRLESPSLESAERDALTHLRALLRQWRQEGVRFESRSIIVALRKRPFDAQPLAPFRAPKRVSGGS